MGRDGVWVRISPVKASRLDSLEFGGSGADRKEKYRKTGEGAGWFQCMEIFGRDVTATAAAQLHVHVYTGQAYAAASVQQLQQQQRWW